jgi:molybdopterin adenylyltransferase
VVESARAHVAILSIVGASASSDVAVENIVANALIGAGHQVTAFETVKDSEVAIRTQLFGWIEDPDIDLVIVIGESSVTSRAMAPLVEQPLPGFADLLRMLAYQELGAGAMLSAPEAARCGTTFVFVLPAGERAARAAMEKLIVPQLDPRTKPHNLADKLPRREVTRVDHAAGPPDSIPVAVKPEKTETGRPSPRPPHKPAPVATIARMKSRTGQDVLVRNVEDPTKPIERQKLEHQIELSKERPTRKDLAALPRLPPGASEVVDPIDGTSPAATTSVFLPAAKPATVARTRPPTARPPARRPTPPVPSSIIARPRASAPEEPVLLVPKAKAPKADKPRSVESAVVTQLGVTPAPPAEIPLLSDSAIQLIEPDAVEDLPTTEPAVPPAAAAFAQAAAPPAASPRAPESDEPAAPREPARAAPTATTPVKPAAPTRAAPPRPAPPIAELPQEAMFAYPTRRQRIWPVVLLLLVMAGLAVGAVILFVSWPHEDVPQVAQTAPAPDAAATLAAGADAGVPDADVPDATASEVEREIPLDAGVTPPRPRPPRRSTPRGTGPLPARRVPDATVAAGAGVAPAAAPDAAPVVGDGDCGEVMCVMEKYARPCCAHWKPADEPHADGGLDKPQIRAGVASVKPAVIACGEKTPVKGTVKLAVTVDPSGAVQEVNVVAAPDDALGSCVATAMRKARFAKTTKGGSFSYPFVF